MLSGPAGAGQGLQGMATGGMLGAQGLAQPTPPGLPDLGASALSPNVGMMLGQLIANSLNPFLLNALRPEDPGPPMPPRQPQPPQPRQFLTPTNFMGGGR